MFFKEFTLVLILVFIFSCFDSIEGKTSDNLLRISLVRKKSELESLLEVETDLAKIEKFYNAKRRAVPRKNDTISLLKYLDSEYYGYVNFGKPGKTFKIIFDSAWPYTWVTSAKCPVWNIACALHNKYDSVHSSTYIPDGRPFSANEGSYNLTGFFSMDVLHLGHVNVTNQTFVEMTNIPYFYALSQADGVIGIGYETFSPGVIPTFNNLFKQNPKIPFIFSIYINRDKSTDQGGAILLGGTDPKHYNKTKGFTYLQIVKKGYWEFQMQRIEVDNRSKNKTYPFCQQGCNAFTDTSTNTIMGPTEDVKKINDIIGAKPFILNRFRIDCAKTLQGPFISFVMGGKNFQIRSRDYIQQITFGGVELCLSAFIESQLPKDYADRWVLGGSFLNKFYTVYDRTLDRIGFAEALQ